MKPRRFTPLESRSPSHHPALIGRVAVTHNRLEVPQVAYSSEGGVVTITVENPCKPERGEDEFVVADRDCRDDVQVNGWLIQTHAGDVKQVCDEIDICMCVFCVCVCVCVYERQSVGMMCK